MSITVISRDELAARLEQNDDVLLVEALGPLYFEDAHLPGALNLDPARFDELVPQLLPDRAAEVVVYCASATCPNSHQAAARLAALGFADVKVYQGGKADWIAAGLPVERGAVAAAA